MIDMLILACEIVQLLGTFGIVIGLAMLVDSMGGDRE